MRIGAVFCGIATEFQVSRLTSRTCGSGLRAWMSETSSVSSWPSSGSAT